jgi:hypothetical protein
MLNFSWMQAKGKFQFFSPSKFMDPLTSIHGLQINHLTPNGHCSGHTAPLTYRCCILLFIQQIYVRNILNMLHNLRVFLFKMSFIS